LALLTTDNFFFIRLRETTDSFMNGGQKMHIAAMILATWFFTGCEDIPYKEPGSTLNLDGDTAKNAVPVEIVERENADTKHAPSIVEAAGRNAVEIEDVDSDSRSRSRRHDRSDDPAPPYLPPAVEEEARNLSMPKIEIALPLNNSLVADKWLEVKGSIDHPELIRSISVRCKGQSETNNLIDREKSINSAENNFGVIFDDLPDGDYGLTVTFVGADGIEHLLPELKVSIDGTPPKILGAFDGIVQRAYLQETTAFKQYFIDDGSNPRYEIAPIGEAAPLKFETIPTISRWITLVSDDKTAPIYAFKINDADVAEIEYDIDLECASFDEVSREAIKGDDGTYEIKIIPSTSDLDLDDKKFCLSIWATDLAGNKGNHQAEFIWKIVVPPMALDMNAASYNANHRRDDISWADLPARQLFRDTLPIALKRDLVVGHTIISNPFSSPVAIKLEMKKPLYLKVNSRHYSVPANNVFIQYFAYDLTKNEIGLEKPVDSSFAIVDGNETLVAQFVLARDFPLTGVRHPKRSFWRSFSLDVGFSKSRSSHVTVDGLSLITRNSVDGLLSSEFVVPWGENHEVRKKVVSRERGRR
jgi:hypothetical protein